MTKTETLKPPRVATCTLVGISALYQGAPFDPNEKKRSDETHDEFDRRCWKQRAHIENGVAVVPGAAIHKALIAAAKFRNETIPGQGKKTWTKRFGAGCLVMHNPVIAPDTPLDDVEGHTIHVPSDGRPGGSTRVYRTFPVWHDWTVTVDVTVLDGLIDEDTFYRHLDTAGKFIGVGCFRPSSPSPNVYGRFKVGDVAWREVE